MSEAVPPTPADPDTTPVRPVYVRALLDAVGAMFGVDTAALLRRHGLQPWCLEDDAPLLDLLALEPMLIELLSSIPDPAFSLRPARHLPLSRHGALGLALQHAPSLRRALALLAVHMRTRSPLVVSTLRREPGGIVLELAAACSMRRLERYVMERTLSSRIDMLCQVAGVDAGPMPGSRLDLPWSPPADPHRLAAFRALATEVRFRKLRLALFLPDDLLDRPAALADPARFAKAHEALQAEMPCGIPRSDLVPTLRAWLDRSPPTVSTRAEAAMRLGVSDRTLGRWLIEEGTSFPALQSRRARELAWAALADPDLSMAEVARRAGLTSQANLARQCRRWFGQSPAELRRQWGRADPAQPLSPRCVPAPPAPAAGR